MMAGFVEPDCKPEGFEASVVLAARGTCISSSTRDLSFSCASMQGTSKDCNVGGEMGVGRDCGGRQCLD